MTDIAAFEKSTADSRAAVLKFVARADRGLPPDRWAVSTDEMRLVVEGIRAELHIQDLLTEALLSRMGLSDDK
jgi:predicted amino acid dehydrogenase